MNIAHLLTEASFKLDEDSEEQKAMEKSKKEMNRMKEAAKKVITICEPSDLEEAKP